MLNMKKILFIATAFFIFSCNETSKVENFLITLWAVDSIEINEVNLGRDQIFHNTFLIERDGICNVPMINGKFNSSAHWIVEKNESDQFIFTIKGAERDEFNGRFRVFIDQIEPIKKMRFVSDKVVFNCSASNYP